MSASKRAAGRRAADVVETGQDVGLGTGSTVFFALERLGERIRDEGLVIRGVPTSVDTETKAREFGVPLAALAEVERFDVTIDGAAEIDGDCAVIKGGGGALLREKVVAAATEHMVVVVGPEKVVGTLGTTFDLPVEVVPFARAAVERGIRALGGAPKLREAGAAAYLTDNGNQILDVHFESGISDAAQLELALDASPRVVETGLLIHLARTLVIGHDDGSADLRKKGA